MWTQPLTTPSSAPKAASLRATIKRMREGTLALSILSPWTPAAPLPRHLAWHNGVTPVALWQDPTETHSALAPLKDDSGDAGKEQRPSKKLRPVAKGLEDTHCSRKPSIRDQLVLRGAGKSSRGMTAQGPSGQEERTRLNVEAPPRHPLCQGPRHQWLGLQGDFSLA